MGLLNLAKQQETLFKEQVWADLKRLPNTWAHKTQEVAKRGVPDFLVCVNGVFLALELKTETGTLDPLQEYKLKKIQEANGIAIVATPKNWAWVFRELLDISNGGNNG